MNARTAPVISVVILLDGQRRRGGLCLASVLAQSIAESLEVLLLDLGHDRFEPIEGADHPSVRVIPISPNTGYGATLAQGVDQARSPIVAFVEEHVQVFPGWAEGLIAAYDEPWAAVCGEVYPGDLERFVARLIELVGRHDWSAPAKRGEATVLRWQNVSYRRDVLLRYKDRLPLLLQSEGALFQQLRADGEGLFIAPDAKFIHAHELSWISFLKGSYYSTRLATASLVQVSGKSRGRKLAAALVGPLRWPLVLLRRTRSISEASLWERRFWMYAPFIVQYYSIVALSTVVGLFFGPGDCARRFLDFEANAPRLVPDPSIVHSRPGQLS